MPELSPADRIRLDGIDAEARRVMRDYRGEGEPLGNQLGRLFNGRLAIGGERDRIARAMLPPGLYHVSVPLEQVMIRFAEKSEKPDGECHSPASIGCGIPIRSPEVNEKTPARCHPGEGQMVPSRRYVVDGGGLRSVLFRKNEPS